MSGYPVRPGELEPVSDSKGAALTRSAHRRVPRLNHRLLVAPAIAVAAIAVTACGGSSNSGAAATTTTHSTIPASAFLGTRTGTTAAKTSGASTKSTTKASAPKPHASPKHEAPKPPAKPKSLGPPLSASAMAQKANAACAAYKSAASSLSQPSDFSSNVKSAATYLGKLVKLDLTETNALHFNPPRSQELNYAHFFGDVLHHHLLLTIAWDEAQGGKHDYMSYYNQAASYKTSTLDPLARQLHFTSCAS